jgi:hypothetical protein
MEQIKVTFKYNGADWVGFPITGADKSYFPIKRNRSRGLPNILEQIRVAS